ncbi:MAG TPA: glycerate kinase [Candidatus Methylomirabilis sp.]|nr:glycerate kinase [Candidatus Methylomirabilis sp.]
MRTPAALREDATAIFRAALEAVDPAAAIKRHVRRERDQLRVGDRSYDLARLRRIFVLGAGKAGAPMAAAVEEILGERITAGVVTVKAGHGGPTRIVRIQEAAHPVPDAAGLAGAQAILDLAKGAGADDLVIALISGGGSALLPLPVRGITLEEKQQVTKQLLACGATIQEINAVRKHISAVKGGQLARAAAPAQVLTLVLSDIVGDPLDAIASGPTAPDGTTFREALAILDRYGIRGAVPPAVGEYLEAGAAGRVPETPKPGDPLFQQVHHRIVANNAQALEAAAAAAAARGYRPLILASGIQGEAREVAKVLAALLLEVRATGRPIEPPCCLVAGGETTVTLHGKGRGGRNQEMALAAAFPLEGAAGILFFSAGTDGTDGPTDAAGAVSDGQTVPRGRAAGLDPARHLAENDAYSFFRALGDLVVTGPTRTNVMDIHLLLCGPRPGHPL